VTDSDTETAPNRLEGQSRFQPTGRANVRVYQSHPALDARRDSLRSLRNLYAATLWQNRNPDDDSSFAYRFRFAETPFHIFHFAFNR
jgi:hypothetical protein